MYGATHMEDLWQLLAGAAEQRLRPEVIAVRVPQVAQLLAVGLADKDIKGRGAAVAGEGTDGGRGRRNLLAVMQHDRSLR